MKSILVALAEPGGDGRCAVRLSFLSILASNNKILQCGNKINLSGKIAIRSSGESEDRLVSTFLTFVVKNVNRTVGLEVSWWLADLSF
jgi:hypothetical protein